MRSLVVGFLAVGWLSACGVGVDDPLAAEALGASTAALSDSDSTSEPRDDGEEEAEPPESPPPSPADDPGQVALPQDPIPVLTAPLPMPGSLPAPGATPQPPSPTPPTAPPPVPPVVLPTPLPNLGGVR